MTYEAKLRKVGGSVMVAIPSLVMDELGLSAGNAVGLEVKSGNLVMKPKVRRRYTLDELLKQAKRARLPKDRAWAAGKAVGRELI